MPAFTQPQSNAGTNPAQITVPWIKNAFSWDFHHPKMIKTHIKNVRDLNKKAKLLLPLLSTDFYPDGNSQGNTMENSGKQNPKRGFKSPPEQRRTF
jgi:hypothetical protein